MHESLTVSDEAGLHRFPHVLPDGTRVMFTVGSGDVAQLAVLSIETGDWRVLPNQGIGPKYADGYITYGQGDSLWTQAFDLDQVTTTGDPRPIVRELGSAVADGAPIFAVSRSGSLAYVEGRPRGRLVWVDRAGQVTPFGDRADFAWVPRLSPSGQQLATIIIERATDFGLWILDLERGSRTRLTVEANGISPTWRPDGTHLAYQTDVSGTWRAVWRGIDGSGAEEALIPSQVGGELWVPTSWTPDGTAIAFTVGNPGDGWDIWVMSPGSAPEPLVAGPGDDVTPAISPDGQRVAYASNASGRFEVYLRAYDEAGGGIVVSANGGYEPRWSRDGRELFYRSGNRMMVASIPHDPELQAGAPQMLFEEPFMMSSETIGGAVSAPPNYDVSLDGERFLMVQEDPSSVPTRIHVVHDWINELRVPTP